MARVILTHPLGSPFACHAAMGLRQSGLLKEVLTSFCFDRTGLIAGLSAVIPAPYRAKLLTQLERRNWIDKKAVKVTEFPLAEFIRMAAIKSGLSEVLGYSYQQLADYVFEYFDRKAAQYIQQTNHAQAIYAYEDSALESFKAAKAKGMCCIYDLPILYCEESRRIEEEEAELFPEFQQSLFAAQDNTRKINRKKDELLLADHLIVASSITKNSLIKFGFPERKISVIPYGAPLIEPALSPKKSNSIFKVIFVGRVTPRKGVHYLIEAWQKARLKDAELALIGINEYPRGSLRINDGSIRLCGSVPQNEVFAEMQTADLLVLPSLVEGFGMVLLEAMAFGVPVITTTNTAGSDIVQDGVQGFVVPIRDSDALAEKVTWCRQNPSRLLEMREEARKQAQKFSWERYQIAIAERIQTILAEEYSQEEQYHTDAML